MFYDWLHWLTSLHPDEMLAIFGGLLLTDGPRYAVAKLLTLLWDVCAQVVRWFRGTSQETEFQYCPSVCILLAGYNEADGIGKTIDSLAGIYPKLEIVFVDDGSTDGTAEVARRHAAGRPDVKVVRREPRGGKSSALNLALRYTDAEIVMTVDADTSLSPTAIWEIVQPFKDPNVGLVSGNVLVRNFKASLASLLQAYEYLNCILVGRILSSRLGILAIASGALSAFRREAILRFGGWDVGPGEDADITMKLRKMDYKVKFVPYSHCYTDAPTSWKALFRQRLRWDRSLLRLKCRKHIDMGNPFSRHFRLGTFVHLLDVWYHNVFCTYALWIYMLTLILIVPNHLGDVLLTTYLAYVCFAFVQSLTVLYYTDNLPRDASICLVFPLAPLYYFYLRVARTVALTTELFWRQSYRDNHVPPRVREATWKW